MTGGAFLALGRAVAARVRAIRGAPVAPVRIAGRALVAPIRAVRRMSGAAAVAVTLALVAPALAVNPSEELTDPALEARAREISAELRCLVCQNQSIDASDADLAKDLRLLVRERLEAGDTNAEVFRYVTDRYGDFVLLKPPVKGATIVLWLAPFVVALVAVAASAVYVRRRRTAGEAKLTVEEEAELARLLAEREGRAP
jgi:cytochrome c-type biogenesis protein CcmH